MSRSERIEKTLAAALAPAAVTVVDDSERHRGHGGWREGGETHYRLKVVSASFAGKSRVARHRLVMDLLAAEFAGGLHALAIEARTPDEG